MTKRILMGASFLALLAAYPAFAVDVKAEADANVSTGTKIENTLDDAGKTISEKAHEAGKVIDEKTEKAGAVVKDKYTDVKAYFSDDKDIKAVSSVNVLDRLTADELIGATVQNPKGEDIGKVEDVLVDAEGDAERVIINDGGVLGLGGKLASFDYDIIEGINGNEDVVVKLTDKAVTEARGFSYESSTDAKVTAMPADLYSVKKIIGSKVVDAEGKAVAKVDTVAFEGDDADYIIVTFNKILGMGGDKAALDFEALDLSNNSGKYTFKLNANQTAQFQNFKDTTKAN